MKKNLSVILCNTADGAQGEPDGVELMFTDEVRTSGEIIKNAVKQAKGKYICLLEGSFKYADIAEFMTVLDKCSADAVICDGGYCFKSTIFKSLNLDENCFAFTCEIAAMLSSKSVLKSDIKPFTLAEKPLCCPFEIAPALLSVLDDFKKCRTKLSKEAYSAVFDLICTRLTIFYMSAALEVREGKIKAQSLIDFDGKLKDNVILYLTLEKRFTSADLNKLRKKGFKVGFLTANKFKKALKL